MEIIITTVFLLFNSVYTPLTGYIDTSIIIIKRNNTFIIYFFIYYVFTMYVICFSNILEIAAVLSNVRKNGFKMQDFYFGPLTFQCVSGNLCYPFDEINSEC